jgi:hypothetical protein
MANQFIRVGSGGTPEWFLNLPYWERRYIAGGPGFGQPYQNGATMFSVMPNPYPYSNNWGTNSHIVPWTCGEVIQSTGEFITAAEGGHGDGVDHSIYAFLVRTAVPFWSRIWGPNIVAGGHDASAGANLPYCAWGNGTPRTAHGWFSRVVSQRDNRIWLTMCNEGASGAWSSDQWSISRDNLGPGVVAANLWMYHGRLWTDGVPDRYYQSAPHAYDEVAHAVMHAVEGSGTGQGVHKVDVATCIAAGNQATTGPKTPGCTTYDVGYGSSLSNSWSVITYNTSPRCWIMGGPDSNVIAVWNLEAPNGIRFKTVGGSISNTSGMGAFYNPGGRKIIVGGPLNTDVANDTNFYTMNVPSDPWNASTGFTVATRPTTGDAVQRAPVYRGTYGKFRAIDMPNGEQCAVWHSGSANQPSMVARIPQVA